MRVRRAVWLLCWIVLTAAAALFVRTLPWRAVLQMLTTQRIPFALLAVLASAAILPLWALEWERLSPARERPGARRMFEVVAITSATLNTIPFFAGEAAAVLLLVARSGLSRTSALSVLALDQLLVGASKLVVIAAAAAIVPLPPTLRAGILALAAIVGVGLAALVALAWWAPKSSDRVTPSFVASAAGFVRRLADRLEVLRDPRGAVYVLALALLKKSAEVVAVVAAQHALGVALPWWSAVLVVAALGIGTMLPLAPANLGTYEATAFVVYRYLGVPSDVAIGLAIAQHLYFLIPAVGVGWLVLLVRQFARPALSSAQRASAASDDAPAPIARS